MASSAEEKWKASKALYRDAKVAGEYDTIRYRGVFRGTMKQRLHERTLRAAFEGLPKGATLLDVPVGTGRFTNFLVEEGYRVVGADISPEMIAEAKRKVAGTPENLLGFPVCSVEALPFRDKSVDCTLTVRFMHLVPLEMWPAIFRELARVAKTRVVLCVNIDKFALKFIARRLAGKANKRWMSQTQFTKLLAENGLTVTRYHAKMRFLSTLWVVECRPS